MLAWLFLGTFAVGSGELLVAGLLNLISGDLRVSVPAAGLLVTANAVGLAVGGPILTVLTLGVRKRRLLACALAAYLLANLTPVLIPNYQLFLGARVFGGAVQGLFVAAAFGAAADHVAPERRGRAVAVILTGFTIAATVGVPAGTLAGQAVGWRGSFTIVVVLTALVLLAAPMMLPTLEASKRTAGHVKDAFAPKVLALLGLVVLIFAAVSSVLTYIVPLLRNVTGVSASTVSVFLFVYGVASAVGSIGGGRLADANSSRTCMVGTVGLTVSLGALYASRAIPTLVLLAILAWGLFAFGMGPALQYRVIGLAGAAKDLAAALPASAANSGIAIGSAVGGAAIAALDTSAAIAAGLSFAALAVCSAWMTKGLE
ncbi:MAG: MFS transporter [Jatrophihabitans sp.]